MQQEIGLVPGESQRKLHCRDTYVHFLIELSMRVPSLSPPVENAVDPQNFEPNLALDLEIADIINSKKGNASASLAFYRSFFG